MRIGILGSGAIGATLARVFSEGGHEVAVANSRGPETIDTAVLEFGARAVTPADAVRDKDVVILSVPFFKVPEVAGLFASVPDETVVIDTTNYVPFKDWDVPIEGVGQGTGTLTVGDRHEEVPDHVDATTGHALDAG